MLGPGREHQQDGLPLLAGARFAHSSSVTKGMKGWSSSSAWSSTQGGHGARLGGGFGIAAGEDRLDQLEIPVAEDVPDEMVDGARGFVEADRPRAPR